MSEEKRRGRMPVVTEEMKQQIKTRYESGQSLDRIALSLDLSRTTIRRHLGQLGVKIRERFVTRPRGW